MFISYNHGSKSTVLRVRDRLKAAGFTVWIDEDEMCMLSCCLQQQQHCHHHYHHSHCHDYAIFSMKEPELLDKLASSSENFREYSAGNADSKYTNVL